MARRARLAEFCKGVEGVGVIREQFQRFFIRLSGFLSSALSFVDLAENKPRIVSVRVHLHGLEKTLGSFLKTRLIDLTDAQKILSFGVLWIEAQGGFEGLLCFSPATLFKDGDAETVAKVGFFGVSLYGGLQDHFRFIKAGLFLQSGRKILVTFRVFWMSFDKLPKVFFCLCPLFLTHQRDAETLTSGGVVGL